ncbi:molecular chaperone DjiA [Frigidibacter sp. SD6-1]|uniref:molecular chaperone DjiA n=1 Tax=Frigidibacter sp. SD6-1 TaxID=3032581 RepID=UPI0024E038DF|nr:molecular chaperone DjiA [Frigidibacter sp. SD6-1]
MSIWTRIADALSALRQGEGLAAVFEKLRTPPEKTVGFTIAVIALGAKMAKADGQVTRDEVRAFRSVFLIAPEDEANAARVFNLARQDVAGFDHYARRIAGMFGPGDPVLIDLVDGLFHIAVANGEFHEVEEDFLRTVADIFGVGERCFRTMHARHVPGAPRDPFEVLGLEPGAPVEAARAAWRQAVKESHPDVLAARGLPEEAIRLAEDRLRDVNRAWEEINRKVPA